MTALFEGGNSRLHFGWWNEGSVTGAVNSEYPAGPDGMATLVRDLLGNIEPELIMACSVSPKHGTALFSSLASIAQGRVHYIHTAADLGVRVRYDFPERYGIDRALAALAAWHFFHDSCVVIDAGTAITVDAVDSDGNILGGYIMPGKEAMAEALSIRTALPGVSPGEPDGLLGNSTETCISRGIAEGASGAVRRLFERAAHAAGSGVRVMVTGGTGRLLLPALPSGAKYRQELALEGLGLASLNAR